MKSSQSSITEQKLTAVAQIYAELRDILKNEKCRSCSCFFADVLNSTLDKIRIFRKATSDKRLTAIENDFEHWIKDADFLKMHG
jgi:hypothetical protein